MDGAITMLLKCSSVMATPSIKYRLCPLRWPRTFTRLPACCIASPRVPPGGRTTPGLSIARSRNWRPFTGKSTHLLAPDHVPDFRGGQLHASIVRHHRHNVVSIAHLQGEVAPQPVAGVDSNARQRRLLEIRRAHRQRIHADGQLAQQVFAGAVGGCGELLPGSQCARPRSSRQGAGR